MLVATDFDGTISAIVLDPGAAVLLPGAAAALAALARHPRARVAVISGRSLADLRARCTIPGVQLVGGHGNEREHGGGAGAKSGGSNGPRWRQPAGQLREEEMPNRPSQPPRPGWSGLEAEMARQAARWPGAQLEVKPWSLTLHYRRVPQFGAAILAYARDLAAQHGLRLVPGACIAELLPPEACTKGDAVLDLRRELGCDLALYLGDQATDEDVFAAADEDLIGIRIGAGPTRAPLYLPDPPAAVAFLAALPALLGS